MRKDCKALSDNENSSPVQARALALAPHAPLGVFHPLLGAPVARFMDEAAGDPAPTPLWCETSPPARIASRYGCLSSSRAEGRASGSC